MATKIRPLNDRIIVKRIEDQEQMRGGLYIPDTAKEKPQEGQVLAVGNGKLLENGSRIAIDLNAGDRVLFGQYAGTEVKLDGEELLILREDDILGVVRPRRRARASRTRPAGSGRNDRVDWHK
jgi:chaperonin GroES